MAVGYVGVFIEAGECGAIVTGKAEGAVGKDALGIYEVQEDFLYGPLAGGIGIVALFFGYVLYEGGEGLGVQLECFE